MAPCKTATEPSAVAPYLVDESRMEPGRAEGVAWPADVDEAASALRDAAEAETPVTVSGAGTGVTGGRIPEGGLVLATDALNGIGPLEPSPDGKTATLRAQCGATLADVSRYAAERGWLYPPDPTEPGASIGGTLATNASGPRSYRFGATRRHVVALTGALADGRSFRAERGEHEASEGVIALPLSGGGCVEARAPDWRMPATRKHAAGYFSRDGMDVVDLLVGSEGTLAVLLEAELRLVRAPTALASGFFFFPDESRALGFVESARGPGAGVEPWCLELFDAASLEILRRRGHAPPSDARAAIFVEQPLADDRAEAAAWAAWARLAEEAGAHDTTWVADAPADREAFRRMRHDVPAAIGETLARRGVTKVATDTAVPPGRLAPWLRDARRRLERGGIEHVVFGHVGDDHLHVNLIAESPSSWLLARAAYHDLVRAAVAAGGTVSAEHGIGKLKRESLALLYDGSAIEKMRALRAAFDPAGRLGRGTMLQAAP